MSSDLNNLKKYIFNELMNISGRVFIVIRYSDEVHIGRRGFLPEEKEKGLVLVFNNRMNFKWDKGGISARLAFGSTFEDCYIPDDDIFMIFSPELNAQFTVSPIEKKHNKSAPEKTDESKSSEKVVKIDFRKKK